MEKSKRSKKDVTSGKHNCSKPSMNKTTDTGHPVWERGIAVTTRCFSGSATKMSESNHWPYINLHVPRANDLDKYNTVMIIEKNTTPEEDEFYEYPYYIARIQRRFSTRKRRWFREQYLHQRSCIIQIASMHLTDLKKKVMYIVFLCHFTLVDPARDTLYALGTPTIHD